MLSKHKLLACNLLISLLMAFSAQVRSESSSHHPEVNSEVTHQLRALVLDLDTRNSVTDLIDKAGLVSHLNNQIFGVQLNSQSLSVDQYFNLIKRKDIESLRKSIRHYKLLSRYQWPTVTPIELRLGIRTKEIAKLRWMLARLGDIPAYSIPPYRESIFDPSVEAGLKRFQRRHGHFVDGKLQLETVLSLNTEPSIRVTQLQDALKESLKKHDKTKDYVSVNLIDHTLRITRNGVEQLVMPVIVGKPTSKTPELNTTISAITVNPAWRPPASIIYSDILRSVEKQPNYLRNNDFVFKSYTSNLVDDNVAQMDTSSFKHKLKTSALIQLPGSKNALGKLRFTIPNSDAIFLHDTPRKHLFNRANRALSHGCIRLSQPEVFAKYLMNKEPYQTRQIFKNALKSNQTRHFRLTSQLNINIAYQKVWIDKDGHLQVRDNVSGLGREDG